MLAQYFASINLSLKQKCCDKASFSLFLILLGPEPMRRQESSWLTNESSGHSELEGNGHPWLSGDHYNQVQQKIGPSIVLAMSGARNLICVVIIHYECLLFWEYKLKIATRFLCAPVHRQRLTLNTGQVRSSRSQDFSPFPHHSV